MRKEVKEFLKSDEMVLIIPREGQRNAISQWVSFRNPLMPPLRFVLANIAKIIPVSSWVCAYYRLFFGMKIGKRVGVAPMDPDYLFPEAIEIGDDSIIGWRVILGTHEFSQKHSRYGKIKIGKNVLIGAKSSIRGGVSIGDNSIVSACSFVTKNIPPNQIWSGVPARQIGRVRGSGVTGTAE